MGTSRDAYHAAECSSDGEPQRMTLFGFALRSAGAACTTAPVPVWALAGLAAGADPRVLGWFVFTDAHVHTVRRMPDGAFLEIDSVGGVHPLPEGYPGTRAAAAVYAEVVLERAPESKPGLLSAAAAMPPPAITSTFA
jgi:hypothetical protein